jgi:O-antigen/teichoic acid export membrane protein
LIDPAVPPTRSSFLRDSTLTLVTRLLVLASSIFANIVIARALGPELKGTYSLLLLVVSIGALATVCGLPSAIVYFGARDRRELPYQAGNAIVASIVFGLAGSLGVLGSTRLPAAGAFLARNGVALDAVQALALLVPLIQWNTIVPEVLRARGEIGRYNALLLAHAAAGAAFVAARRCSWSVAGCSAARSSLGSRRRCLGRPWLPCGYSAIAAPSGSTGGGSRGRCGSACACTGGTWPSS